MENKQILLLGAVSVIAIVVMVTLFQAQIEANAVRQMPRSMMPGSYARAGQNTGTQDMYKKLLESQKAVQMPSGPGVGQMLPGMYTGSAGQNRMPVPQTGMPQPAQQPKSYPGYMPTYDQKTQEMIRQQQAAHNKAMQAIRTVR